MGLSWRTISIFLQFWHSSFMALRVKGAVEDFVWISFSHMCGLKYRYIHMYRCVNILRNIHMYKCMYAYINFYCTFITKV